MLSLDKREGEGEGKGEGVRGEGRSVQYYDIMIERVCGVSHVKDVIWREREKGCVVREVQYPSDAHNNQKHQGIITNLLLRNVPLDY